ncbi:MAG TPA: ABC transporter permease [Candidatus Nanopelagicales bacterium]|nr:ABC transporter permease [Candidatus Nanopelagicales bacterium]
MSSAVYVRAEIRRTLRNRRFLVFSLGFPLLLFLIVAGANREVKDFAGSGISFALYYMVGMVSWGSMAAVIAGGARIATERQIGWTRQLRLTPLSARTYFATKVASGYVLALASIVVLYLAGALYGVRLPAEAWIRMTLLILVGLVPFAVLGILFGHLLSTDSLGPAVGGVTALFALLGGAWGPIAGGSELLSQLAQLLPSYWLTQAAHSAFTGEVWPAKAWIVLVVWTVVLARLARAAYLRDTAR